MALIFEIVFLGMFRHTEKKMVTFICDLGVMETIRYLKHPRIGAPREGLEAKTTRLHTVRTCPPSGVFEIHSGVPRWETRTEETNEPGCQKEMDTVPRSARGANTITGALGAEETEP